MSTRLHSRPDGRTPRFVLVMFPLGHLVNDWPGAALWLLAPAMALSYDLSTAEVGLLLTLHGAGASLGYLPAGIIGDRISNRSAALVTTFLWVAIGYGAAAYAGGLWSLGAALAVAGIGAAAVMIEGAPERRAQLIGIHAVGGSLAEVGAPLVAGALLTLMDWPSVLLWCVVPPAVLGGVFFVCQGQVPRSSRAKVSAKDVGGLSR
ncbi:MAG: MFS transporter [Chromatiales bacterium]|jgi:MFS transporter, FSR family, fosmidomycin resistance protein|nr:MFS transporter [Chromatiales bacterium]